MMFVLFFLFFYGWYVSDNIGDLYYLDTLSHNRGIIVYTHFERDDYMREITNFVKTANYLGIPVFLDIYNRNMFPVFERFSHNGPSKRWRYKNGKFVYKSIPFSSLRDENDVWRYVSYKGDSLRFLLYSVYDTTVFSRVRYISFPLYYEDTIMVMMEYIHNNKRYCRNVLSAIISDRIEEDKWNFVTIDTHLLSPKPDTLISIIFVPYSEVRVGYVAGEESVNTIINWYRKIVKYMDTLNIAGYYLIDEIGMQEIFHSQIRCSKGFEDVEINENDIILRNVLKIVVDSLKCLTNKPLYVLINPIRDYGKDEKGKYVFHIDKYKELYDCAMFDLYPLGKKSLKIDEYIQFMNMIKGIKGNFTFVVQGYYDRSGSVKIPSEVEAWQLITLPLLYGCDTLFVYRLYPVKDSNQRAINEMYSDILGKLKKFNLEGESEFNEKNGIIYIKWANGTVIAFNNSNRIQQIYINSDYLYNGRLRKDSGIVSINPYDILIFKKE